MARKHGRNSRQDTTAPRDENASLGSLSFGAGKEPTLNDIGEYTPVSREELQEALSDDIDWDETTTMDENIEAWEHLSERQLRKLYNHEALNDMDMQAVRRKMDDWKYNSEGQGRADLENMYDQLLDLPGNLFDGLGADPDEVKSPTEQQLKQAAATTLLSRVVLQELHGDEVTTHRGIQTRGAADLTAEFFENPTGDAYAFAENKIANYSEKEATGDRFAEDHFRVTRDIPVDSVIAAPDHIRSTNAQQVAEAEIWLPGGHQSVNPEDVKVGERHVIGGENEEITLDELQKPFSEYDETEVEAFSRAIEMMDSVDRSVSEEGIKNIAEYRDRAEEVGAETAAERANEYLRDEMLGDGQRTAETAGEAEINAIEPAIGELVPDEGGGSHPDDRLVADDTIEIDYGDRSVETRVSQVDDMGTAWVHAEGEVVKIPDMAKGETTRVNGEEASITVTERPEIEPPTPEQLPAEQVEAVKTLKQRAEEVGADSASSTFDEYLNSIE